MSESSGNENNSWLVDERLDKKRADRWVGAERGERWFNFFFRNSQFWNDYPLRCVEYVKLKVGRASEVRFPNFLSLSLNLRSCEEELLVGK